MAAFYQSLNGAKSASRSAIEEVKKGKSSKFNPRDDEQVKSSPNLKVWSQEGYICHPQITMLRIAVSTLA